MLYAAQVEVFARSLPSRNLVQHTRPSQELDIPSNLKLHCTANANLQVVQMLNLLPEGRNSLASSLRYYVSKEMLDGCVHQMRDSRHRRIEILYTKAKVLSCSNHLVFLAIMILYNHPLVSSPDTWPSRLPQPFEIAIHCAVRHTRSHARVRKHGRRSRASCAPTMGLPYQFNMDDGS